MSVKLGTLDIQFKVGSADCTVYLGETLIYSGDTPTPPTPTPSYSGQYLTFVAQSDGTFKFSGNSINYSIDDGTTWTTLASKTDSPTVTSGSKIMWKAELTPSSSKGIGTFSSTANFTVEGNAMSLLYGDNFIGVTDLTGKDYAFKYLFKSCTTLTNAENLSLLATTLADGCYYYMFYGCTSLTTAPSLPATTLVNQCYERMFQGCTSLTAAPELLATTLETDCYNLMFYNCTSLTTAPELPATTLVDGCYSNMFYGCSSLTTAPSLPATTLATECYSGMFGGCTSLTTAPELLATTLVRGCYSNMFEGCTSLTTAPELPATTLVTDCYYKMFNGCTNLSSITCLATVKSGAYCTDNWVNGVAASGTFIKASSMSESTWGRGVNGIPSGWNVQDAT